MIIHSRMKLKKSTKQLATTLCVLALCLCLCAPLHVHARDDRSSDNDDSSTNTDVFDATKKLFDDIREANPDGGPLADKVSKKYYDEKTTFQIPNMFLPVGGTYTGEDQIELLKDRWNKMVTMENCTNTVRFASEEKSIAFVDANCTGKFHRSGNTFNETAITSAVQWTPDG